MNSIDAEKEILPFARCPPAVNGNCLRCPFKGRSIIYGPFKSKRRGISIGINLFPCVKICSFNCVYCFRGSTNRKVVNFTEGYLRLTTKVIEGALKEAIKSVGKVDAIDFSGSGEPTLHPRLNDFIDIVKKVNKEMGCNASIGIFTNSSTLNNPKVINTLIKLDHVEAKLDTVIEWKFKIINRPHKNLSVSNIIENLRKFRRVYDGFLAIQIMLLKYIKVSNYTKRDAILMAEALTSIEPDAVHVYTVYRQPRLKTVSKPSYDVIKRYADILLSYGLRVEVFT